MTNGEEEKIRLVLRSYLSQQRKNAKRADCPDEESLAGFLGGSLPKVRKKQLERHLAGCFFCLDEIVAAHKAMEGTAEQGVPKDLIKKAMDLVPSVHTERDFFELVVKLAKDSLELISTSGQSIFTPAPLGVRRGVKRAKPRIVQVKKEMGRFKVTAEVEQVDSGLCQIVVEVKDESEKPIDGVRVSLISEGREQASYLTRRGRAAFDRIAKGEYNLPIRDSGGVLGTIQIKVR